MSQSPANDEVDITAEERINAMRGYQAAWKNPHVSQTAKNEASELLNNELGWDAPRREIHKPDEHHNPAGVEASTRAFNPHDIDHKRSAELYKTSKIIWQVKIWWHQNGWIIQCACTYCTM